MHKVIGFELKKMVSRPGIYILALLLATLLTVTAFIYKPSENKKTYNKLSGSTVVELATDFEVYKTEYDAQVNKTLNIAKSVDSKVSVEYKEEINTLVNIYNNSVIDFCDIAVSSTASTSDKMNSLKAIRDIDTKTGSIDILYATLLNYIGESNSDFYPLTLTKSSYNTLIQDFTEIIDNIDSTFTNGLYTELAKDLINNYDSKVKNIISSIIYPNYDKIIDTFLEDGNYYNVTIERQDIILRRMAEINAEVSEDITKNESASLMDEYNELFNQYRLVTELYTNLFNTNMSLVVLDYYSTGEKTNVKYFDDLDYYTQQELNTKYTHYIENDKSEFDYANPLSFDYTSNEKTNAYDYTYYSLSIFGVILIAFAITFASHAIAGETKEGTMRFVSIRPVSRASLILGKFFSISIISLIMLIFSAVASMVVGGFMFGLSSLNILSVVNATKVVVMHPMVSLVIFVASMYIKLLVYISIAMLLTSFLKSDLLALIITLLVYVVNLMLPLFFGASSWLRFNPLCNIDLYAFIGAGTMPAKSIMGELFTSVIYSGITIWLSSIFIIALIVVLNFIAVYAFKKREL